MVKERKHDKGGWRKKRCTGGKVKKKHRLERWKKDNLDNDRMNRNFEESPQFLPPTYHTCFTFLRYVFFLFIYGKARRQIKDWTEIKIKLPKRQQRTASKESSKREKMGVKRRVLRVKKKKMRWNRKGSEINL